MKNKVHFILLMSLYLMATGCDVEKKKEEQKQPETLTVMAEPRQEDVKKAVLAVNNAIVNPDREVLQELCSEKLTYGHSGGLVQNKNEFIDDLINGPYDFSSVRSSGQTIQLSGNIAVVRDIFLAQATKEGEALEIRIGNIQIYEMTGDGRWQLLARQAYKL